MSLDTICLTVDVEWAHPDVLADLVGLLDERQLRATFFCTGPDTEFSGHERAIHPNFRPDGDCLRTLVEREGIGALQNHGRVFRFVVEWFKKFAPEAQGARGHSLYYDSQLIDIYREHGICYDSSYQLPLATNLRPYWKESGMLELPIFFNDYFELKTGATGFDVYALGLERPGLKVLNFHPNILFLNAPDLSAYLGAKAFYHDPGRLLAARYPRRGARECFVRLLDTIVERRLPTAVLAEVAADWRARNPPPWG